MKKLLKEYRVELIALLVVSLGVFLLVEQFEIRAHTIINAAGAFVDRLNGLAGVATEYQHIFSKGIHLIVPRLARQKRVLAFFAMGFSFAPWWLLVAGMVAAGIAGSWVGTRLRRLPTLGTTNKAARRRAVTRKAVVQTTVIRRRAMLRDAAEDEARRSRL